MPIFVAQIIENNSNFKESCRGEMKSTLSVVFFIIYIHSSIVSVYADGACNLAADPVSKYALNKYKEAYNHADSNAIISWSVTQETYNGILNDLIQKKILCLSDFDKNYSVYALIDEFNKTCQSGKGFIMDSIAERKTSQLKGCGGIEYKKIDATAYFKNEKTRFELPMSLILLRGVDSQFKLMMQIVNYKILQNAQ